MSEPDISTLARRLAEQNNVDWRALSGSGPDGKVVERDVLDYLARVMAGDEALDPTPEPVPEGMEAWPEQDVTGFRSVAGEASTLGELRDEIGNASRAYLSSTDLADSDSVTDSFDVAPTDAYVSHADTPVTATIDEDIFLFDDEDESARVTDEPMRAAVDAVGSVQAPDDLDDLLVAGDDDDVVDDLAALADASTETLTDAVSDSRFGAVETGYLGEDSSFGASDALSAQGGSDSSDGVTFGDGATFGDGYGSATASESSGAGDGAPWGSDINLGDPHEGIGSGDAEVPELWGPERTAHADSDLWSDPGDDVDEPFSTGLDRAVTSFQDEPFSTDDVTAQDDGFTTTSVGAFTSEHTAADPSDDQAALTTSGDGAAYDHDLADVHDAAGEHDADVGDAVSRDAVTRDAVTRDAGLAAVGATVLSGATAHLPLARPGTILRRNIDVSPLAAAQLAVGQELGYSEPLSAAAFLLRAVAKAADGAGMDAGSAGLAVLDGDVAIRRVTDAATRSFGSLLEALDAASHADADGDDAVGIVVADLSGLDVDEAVLELDVPVVSLGRILYDNQRGAYKSTLTLTGPMALDRAAGLLARVAELLDAPVRLVL